MILATVFVDALPAQQATSATKRQLMHPKLALLELTPLPLPRNVSLAQMVRIVPGMLCPTLTQNQSKMDSTTLVVPVSQSVHTILAVSSHAHLATGALVMLKPRVLLVPISHFTAKLPILHVCKRRLVTTLRRLPQTSSTLLAQPVCIALLVLSTVVLVAIWLTVQLIGLSIALQVHSDNTQVLDSLPTAVRVPLVTFAQIRRRV
jgi:hypothetical protein